MTSFVKEFKTFLMRGNVVDLAVGIVIGAAFAKIVEGIVAGLFMPLVGLITGGIDFNDYAPKIPGTDTQVRVGLVIQALINFVIIGFCLFLVVKAMNKLVKKEDAKPPEPTESEKLLTEIRDLLKAR
jgi:large conductance mechanosensitive channel